MNEHANAPFLARQALMAMALHKVPPTPENFKSYYDNIGGAPAHPPSLAAPARAMADEPVFSAAQAQARSLTGVLGIVEAFLGNLAGLFPDNPLLQEQLEIVRDALAAPEDFVKLGAARQTLGRLQTPDIHSHLSAAKIVAQQMADAFMDQMSVAGIKTAEMESVLLIRQNAIASAATHAQINQAVSDMLLDASKARASLGQAKEKMDQTRQKAEEAREAIRELESQLKKASEEAKRDYLTGLLNRRGLDEELELAYAEHELVSVALLDLDNFKKLNDELGHEAGDAALKTLSACIRERLKGSGSSARMGGEEFLILFPNQPASEAKRAVEGLQRALTKTFYMAAEGQRLITFSAGVAQRKGQETPSQTIARADEAMYRAKNLGKNRVEIATEAAARAI